MSCCMLPYPFAPREVTAKPQAGHIKDYRTAHKCAVRGLVRRSSTYCVQGVAYPPDNHSPDTSRGHVASTSHHRLP